MDDDAWLNALRARAFEPGGYDDVPGAPPAQFRRAAWLALLDLPCPQLDPPPFDRTSSFVSDVTSTAVPSRPSTPPAELPSPLDNEYGWHTVTRRHKPRPSERPRPASPPADLADSTLDADAPGSVDMATTTSCNSKKQKRNRNKKKARTRLTPATSLPPHRDEHQVTLDVRRSLVVYCGAPADADPETVKAIRGARRAQLYDLIVSTLRTHPKLAYYQG